MALKDKTRSFGTTEKSDPSFHLDIFDRLYEGNLIITKCLTDEMIDKLIENKEKCILHMTCTGYGSTRIEPNVPLPEWTHEQILKLIENGFPLEQIVLRVDPIIPTEKGINRALSVIELFKDTGIKRVRISFLDMYYHVKNRFHENNIKLPYFDFHAPEEMRVSAYIKVKELCDNYGMALEMCGEVPLTINEETIKTTPCLSQKDVDILGLTDKIVLVENDSARTNCGCAKNKTDLISGIPHQCSNACKYCFWKSLQEI